MSRVNSLREPNLVVYQGSKKEEFLRKIVIFEDLSEKALGVIARRVKTFDLKKGAQVIAEDEAARGVFFVHSGAVS